MYGAKKRRVYMRSYEMPHESSLVEAVYNDKSARILSEQTFQDRNGVITILLKYEADERAESPVRVRLERQVDELD